jgi:cellulose synthase/poly-beta-1,6-N-acetylglucosamine synthase-like glycosyltransferase
MTHQAMLIVFWLSTAMIVYAQLGYPLLMRLWAGLCRKRTRPDPWPEPELPKVSLIIPAFNEEVVLRSKLENSLQIDYPREKLEIIVASDGSRDRTVEIATQFLTAGVVLIDNPVNRGKATVLNEAIERASGEVLCLCDANVMFRREALRTLVDWLREPQVGAVTGDVRLQSGDSEFGEGESFYYRMERQLQCDETTLGSTMGVDGGMYVIRRELFRPIPPETVLDDFLISMNVIRAGRQIVYEPEAIALENGTPKSTDEFRRRVRVAAGVSQTLKRRQFPSLFQIGDFYRWVSHKLVRWLGPLAFVALAASSLSLWNSGWVYRLAVASQILFYGLALCGWLAPRSLRFGAVNVAFYFVLSHLALAIGLVKGAVFRLSGRWQRTDRSPISSQADSQVATR